MNNRLELVMDRYKKKLENYTYIENENIGNIPLGSFIYYISINNLMCKSGLLISIKGKSIFQLMNLNRHTKWFIYTDKNYIFYKIPNRNKFKSMLLDLVKTDFKLLKIKDNNLVQNDKIIKDNEIIIDNEIINNEQNIKEIQIKDNEIKDNEIKDNEIKDNEIINNDKNIKEIKIKDNEIIKNNII